MIVYIQQSPQAAAGEGGAPAAAEVAKRARGGVWPSLVLLLFGSQPVSDAALVSLTSLWAALAALFHLSRAEETSL